MDIGAPYVETSLARIHANIFGSGRGPRTTDVILSNKSRKSFTMASNYCESGGFHTKLFPDHELPSKTSLVYGVDANGFMTGVSCKTRYQSSDGTYFEVTSRNPYIGSNSMEQSHSESLKLTPTLGVGQNNQVRWIIEDTDGN